MGEVVPGVWEPMDGLASWDPLRGGYAFLDRTDGGNTWHCGADLNGGQGGDGDLGAALRFPIAGEVVYVGRWNRYSIGYGNHVWLRLVNGDYLHYCHCRRVLVAAGDAGEAGDVVAEVGKSGNQLWAHCHFEVKREDPAIAGYDYWPYGRSADYVRQHYVRPADWWRELLAWWAQHTAGQPEAVEMLSDDQILHWIMPPLWDLAGIPYNPDALTSKAWLGEFRAGRYRGRPRTVDMPYGTDDDAGHWCEYESGLVTTRSAGGEWSWQG